MLEGYYKPINVPGVDGCSFNCGDLCNSVGGEITNSEMSKRNQPRRSHL
jgi:hypothetical protein